ncbi:cytochrome o ubiquinol oxidase subunit IV [Sphingomonas azotifigens]|uniref:cytochrome o ubiquinol oxidase subunit IV n=1 Tax=Sphingomonas azotifigens TaxID=330920 RepID=UPI000A05B3D9|nr:cytochrome o ubiquinol oxidase subunit IV [Sphingomonas azotifigens]
MTEHASRPTPIDAAPGEEQESFLTGSVGYVIGLLLALALTATSFWAAQSGALWRPGVPIGLCVLAVAQMGVHLVFFLHITTAPDNTNNVLALAFGIIIVLLVVVGSIWIMDNLNANMMPMEQVMGMQQ